MISRKLTAVLALVASANVFAQADNFSGFSVGLNTGFESNKSVLTDTSDATTFTLGTSNTPFDINLGYAFTLSPNSTLGLGVTYDLTNPKTIKDSENTSVSDITKDAKLKNHYSIYIEPGYVFNDSSLFYFKLAYHSGKETIETQSKSITGTGYGFGLRQLIDKNLYLNVGVDQVAYNSVTFTTLGFKSKLTQTLATIGVGYKF